jgi:outer membrane protein TolC
MIRTNFIGTLWMAIYALLITLWAGSVLAQEPDQDQGHIDDGSVQSLPEPLTLEYALSLAGEPHPDVLFSQSDLELAQAGRSLVEAGSGLNVSLRGRLRWVEPSSAAASQEHDDNHVGLFVDKRLYDFGRTRAAVDAAIAGEEGERILHEQIRNSRRLQIMEAYFNVLLSDLEYARDNEAMAVAYIAMDRMHDRQEMGLVSDIEVAREESAYQKSRRIRYASEVRQRITRSHLAQVLNRAGMLSSTLQEPLLVDNGNDRGELEGLEQLVLANNPEILALRKQLESAQQHLLVARAGNSPVVTGELEASEYSRDMGSRDELRAGIRFEVPLYKGGAVKAEAAQRRAQLLRVQAELKQKELEVQQLVLELWQQLYVLAAQRDEAQALMDYRDLYLDRSRGLYELDVKTDIGDAMVQFSEARLQHAKTEYALALVWAQLDVLAGEDVFVPGTIITVTDEQEGVQASDEE